MQRHDCKDFVTLYSTKSWKPEVAIAVPTSDLSDLAWSPDNCCLAVWDSLLTYKALVYASNGALLASYQAYSDGLPVAHILARRVHHGCDEKGADLATASMVDRQAGAG